MKFINHIPAWLRNKYLLTGIAFLVVMFFFDPKDFPSQWERTARLKEYQKNERHLSQQITDAQKELDLLKTNAQTIEKYAREKYLMKKDNEDLFIVPPPNKAE